MKKLSQDQEKSIAKDFKGKTTPNSGGVRAPAALKGDVNSDSYKIECKYTTKSAYRLKFKDLLLIRKYAIKSGRIPLFIFEFTKGKYANRYVCTFEKCEGILMKDFDSINFSAEELFFLEEGEDGFISSFKFIDKEVERCIKVYDYNLFLKRQECKEQ